MSKEFKLADPGEGLHEAEILEVHVNAGDSVEDGDTVLTVETDKANTDVPAPFSGTVDKVKVSEGDTVEVGDVLMTYDDEQDDDSSEATEPEGESDSDSEATADTTDEPDDQQPAHEKNVEMGDIESD